MKIDRCTESSTMYITETIDELINAIDKIINQESTSSNNSIESKEKK